VPGSLNFKRASALRKLATVERPPAEAPEGLRWLCAKEVNASSARFSRLLIFNSDRRAARPESPFINHRLAKAYTLGGVDRGGGLGRGLGVGRGAVTTLMTPIMPIEQRGTEVRVSVRLRKSVLVNRACVGKSSRAAVGSIRRRKPTVDSTVSFALMVIRSVACEHEKNCSQHGCLCR